MTSGVIMDMVMLLIYTNLILIVKQVLTSFIKYYRHLAAMHRLTGKRENVSTAVILSTDRQVEYTSTILHDFGMKRLWLEPVTPHLPYTRNEHSTNELLRQTLYSRT